jgi:hypothetical protein
MPQLYVLTWEFVTKMHKCDFVLKCVMVRVCVCTKRFTDLDKFDFSIIKFAYCVLLLDLSQFFLLPQLPQDTVLASEVVKRDSKIIISSC